MAFVKLKGFAPDAESNEDGIIVEGACFMPTIRGVEPIPTGAPTNLATLSGTCKGAASLTKLDGTRRFFVAIQTSDTTGELKEPAVTTWTDRTRSAGAYTTTAKVLWTFAQYNDVSLAASKNTLIQASISSGDFGDPPTATTNSTASASFVPHAAIVETVLDFVFAFNTQTLEFGDDTNRWQCTAAGDYTDWKPDISTLAASGLLVDSGGPIKAAKRLGSDIIAYKRDSMYLGQFVGPPSIWSFRLIPVTGLGAPGPHAVANIRTAHIFPGVDDFYMYDGTRPIPIGTNRVSEFFFSELNEEFRDQVIAMHDRQTWRVFWFYPTVNSADGSLDSCLIYNYRRDKWGFTRVEEWQTATALSRVQFAMPFNQISNITYDGLGTLYGTYDSLPNSPYDEAFASGSTIIPAFFDSQSFLRRLDGGAFNMRITTGDMGTDDTLQLVTRVRPRFNTGLPDTASATHLVKDNLGESASVAVSNVGLADGSFDSIQTARWHRHRQIYESMSNFEVVGFDIDIKPEAEE